MSNTTTTPDTAAVPELTLAQRNQDQLRIVSHLSEVARRRLAGEDVYEPGDGRYLYKFKPSRKLQLGVLPPQPAPEAPDEGDADQEGEQEREADRAAILADQRGMPPTQGLDFVVTPEGSKAILRLHARFSVYVQRYPTVEQQRLYWGINVAEDGTLIIPGVLGSQEGDEQHGDEGQQGDHHEQGGQRRRRPRQMSLHLVNERFDIDIGPIDVPIDVGAEPRGTRSIEREVEDAIRAALGPVLSEPATVHMFQSGRMTLPPESTAFQGAFEQAIREAEGDAHRERPLRPHTGKFDVNWRLDEGGNLRVHVTLENTSAAPRRSALRRGVRELDRDMHFFNTRLRVELGAGAFRELPFAQLPEDFRFDHLRKAWAHGRNAAGIAIDDHGRPLEPDAGAKPAAVATTTWPTFHQRRLEPSSKVSVAFADLAEESRWRRVLATVKQGMREFAAAWEQELQKPEWFGERKAECERSLADFREELRRFELGVRALDEDPRLRRAFLAANAVFVQTGKAKGKNITSWRLFQLVFIVIHLSALRAREVNTTEYVSELWTADVLHFPTGGGKSEAYLGLIAAALFYDRLRGKRRGTTAILRFPLRMLSVQQLDRIGEVVWVCEEVRRNTGGEMAGDPFLLGYYVGESNTPNSLRLPRKYGRSSIVWWEEYLRERAEDALEERVIATCLNPNCPGGEVTLRANIDKVRLSHVCSVCGEQPVVHTDDEVFRYCPAVLVCTVDKLAAVGRVQHVSHLISGPAWECPEHGYFSYHEPRFEGGNLVAVDRCLAAGYCKRPNTDYRRVTDSYDPVPALQIQDEMHLLQEELGTFDAHYETTYEYLQRSTRRDGDGVPVAKPTKLLAATATIERYEEQVKNLYARRARVFPALGWDLEFSFYTELTEQVRRVYVGALPMLRDAAEFGARVQAILHAEIERLADNPVGAIAQLGLEHMTDPEALREELFLYDLSLGYVNRKRDGNTVADQLKMYEREYTKPDPSDGGEVSCDRLVVQPMSSDAVTLADIANILGRIGTEDLSVPRPERLRAIVGTSLVSHGIDIGRLNLMVMNWMPSNVADYIQATSRAGRLHVGLIVVGHDRANLRDRSHFHYFLPYHRFLDRLVAPVPVNRFAKFGIERTLTGVVAAIILQAYAREAYDPPRSLERRSKFLTWLNSRPANELEAELCERACDCLGLIRKVLNPDGSQSHVFDRTMVDALRADVEGHVAAIFADLKGGQADKLIEMLNPAPMTSFRDVDETLGFSSFGKSERAIEKLIN
ncbi:MAG TPA: helicase-related protein [Thermoanaerobaculia bacterium]|nr:helicase-related protein [Thermoanaerobaculia bacterium]